MDYPSILAMNEESVHFLSPMDEMRLVHLHAQSELLWVVDIEGTVAAFLLAIRESKDYDSVNYQWFDTHYEHFLYVDRVVVSQAYQGRGLGQRLYEAIGTYAKSQSFPYITAEIDIEPPNPGSLAFHKQFGFMEVGRQSILEGKKVVSLQVWGVF